MLASNKTKISAAVAAAGSSRAGDQMKVLDTLAGLVVGKAVGEAGAVERGDLARLRGGDSGGSSEDGELCVQESECVFVHNTGIGRGMPSIHPSDILRESRRIREHKGLG